jgi:RNA polymerase sigma-70 factor (ECF subfamily)
MDPSPPTVDEMLRHGAFLRRVVRGLVRDDATADDVVQETWVRSLDRPPADARNVRGWLAVVGKRFALRSLRAESRRARREQGVARPEATEASPDAAELLRWQRRVLEAVATLEPTSRDVVLATFYEGLGPRQVAGRLGIAPREASARLAEALVRLRDHLDRQATGGRRAWVGALLPIWDPRTVGATAAGGGSLATTTVVVAGACLVAGGSLWAVSNAREAAPPPVDPVAVAEAREPALATVPPKHVGVPGLAPAASETEPGRRPITPEEYLRRILGARARKDVAVVIGEILALAPDDGWRVIQAIYGRIDDVGKREQLARAIEGTGHRHEIAVLDLAAQDVDPERARETREWLGRYAFQDFDDAGEEAYRRWARDHAALSVPEAVERSARAWVDRMRPLWGRALVDEIRSAKDAARVDRWPDGVDVALRASGLPALLDDWRARGDAPRDAHEASLAWLPALGTSDAEILALVTRVLREPASHPPGLRAAACRLLGKRKPEGAGDLLIEALLGTPDDADWVPIAQAMAEVQDPKTIPVMIGVIVADDTKRSRYGIGYFGLSRWLDVRYSEDHSGEWWAQWWTENRERLPPEVRGLELPRLSPAGKRR